MAGKPYRIDNEVINAIEDILDHQDERFYAKGDPSTTASLEDVCGPLEGLCWKTNHVVTLYKGIMVNLWTFQPSLVYLLLFFN